MSGRRTTRRNTTTSRIPRGFRWVAGACALLVWVLGLLATSPDLHAALHADADHADHECAITLFSHGAENSAPEIALTTAYRPQVVAVVRPDEPTLAKSTLDWLQPGRGPPVR